MKAQTVSITPRAGGARRATLSLREGRGGRRGFTLIEMMFAILLLGLGLVAVAALFPIAGTVQRNTYDQMEVDQVAASVREHIQSRGFSLVDLLLADIYSIVDDALSLTDPQDVAELLQQLQEDPLYALFAAGVRPLPSTILDGEANIPGIIFWTLADRSYPAPPAGELQAQIKPINQKYYWVPLIYRGRLSSDWTLFVFILRRDLNIRDYGSQSAAANPTDPSQIPIVVPVRASPVSGDSNRIEVSGASQLFQIGDLVLDNRGGIHLIQDVGGDTIEVDGPVDSRVRRLWHSPRPPGLRASPTRAIISVGGSVVLR